MVFVYTKLQLEKYTEKSICRFPVTEQLTWSLAELVPENSQNQRSSDQQDIYLHFHPIPKSKDIPSFL